MRKFIKAFIVMLIAVFSLTLISCDEEKEGLPTGTYELTLFEFGGEDMTSSVEQKIIINEGFTCKMVQVQNGQDIIVDGTYTLENNEGEITIVGSPMPFSYADQKITISYTEYGVTQVMVFTFVGEDVTINSNVNTDNKEYVGKYYLTCYMLDGEEITSRYNADSYLTINEDNTYELYLCLVGENEVENGSYTVQGSVLSLTSGNKTVQYMYIAPMESNDSMLVYDFNDGTSYINIVFEK